MDAITLLAGKAHVDAAACRGCEACMEVCPVGAIQPVLEVELLPETPDLPVERSTATRVPATPAPLRQTAVAVVTTVGTGLALRAVETLARAVGRWLSMPGTSTSSGLAARQPGTASGRGRQVRRRQRAGRKS